MGSLDDSHEPESSEPDPVEPLAHEREPEPDRAEPAAEGAAASVDAPAPDDAAAGAPTTDAPRPPRSAVRTRPSCAANLPSLDDLLVWSTRGVATGRTWVVSPSATDLRARWDRLVAAPLEERAELFVVDERRDLDTMVEEALPGQAPARRPMAAERRGAPMPMRYARRSFDRQWLLPDLRVVDRPNVPLWSLRDAPGQLFLTAATTGVPPGGPALVSTAALPQFNHFNGERSRVWPLWLDRDGAEANLADDVLPVLEDETGVAVSAADLIAYVTAVVAHPGYGARFARELSSGVVRVPVTTDAEVLVRGTALGHEVLRMQTLGEHRPPAAPAPSARAAPARGRAGPPPAGSAVVAPAGQPTRHRHLRPLGRHADHRRRRGHGHHPRRLGLRGRRHAGHRAVARATADPGARRRQSRLDLITVDAWEAGWTAELLLVLSALTGLRSTEAAQQALLDEVLQGPHLARADVDAPPPLGPQRLLTIRSAARPARRWRPAPGRP